MRYLLMLLLLLGSLSGCMLFEDAFYYDEPGVCSGAPLLAPNGSAEPPTLAPAAAGVPVQTREPPR